MKATTALFLLFVVLTSSFAQMRMIPHLTRADGTFTSTIILCNTDAANPSSFTLTPYAKDGSQNIAVYEGQLEAGETLTTSPAELFGSSEVSHFTIGDQDAIEVTVAYQDVDGLFSEAHVRDTSTTSPRFRIYPGALDDVLDGLALVNPNSSSLEVHARQVDAAGMVYADLSIFTVGPHAKELFVFTLQGFTRRADTFYEVYAPDSFAMTALRFTTHEDLKYFWETAATPLPMLVQAETDPRIGRVAEFNGPSPNYGVSFRAEIMDERTIQVTNFNYLANGPDVHFYLGQDLVFVPGITVGEQLRDNNQAYLGETLTLTLPASVTLDDFNSISVWCAAFSVDFGSAIFVDPAE